MPSEEQLSTMYSNEFGGEYGGAIRPNVGRVVNPPAKAETLLQPGTVTNAPVQGVTALQPGVVTNPPVQGTTLLKRPKLTREGAKESVARDLSGTEAQLRQVFAREAAVNAAVAAARDANDRKAYEQHSATQNQLFTERERLLKIIKKADPARYEKLLEEITR